MSDFLITKAPAKLNLFLEVGKKLENGYHNIESVMQSVTLYDTLKIKKTQSGILFDCSNKRLIYDGNLVVVAAKLFLQKCGINSGLSLFLQKKIPVSAGLGGGSSDAAAALTALNTMFGRPLDTEKLCELGKTVGADVPFCIKRGICLASGIGEVLQTLDPLPKCYFVIAKGSATVSTRSAFELLDKCSERECVKPDGMIDMIRKKDLHGIAKNLYNRFEIINNFDEKIKSVLKKHNAVNALLSGSGPSVFGIFEHEEDACRANTELRADGYTCFVCAPEKI